MTSAHDTSTASKPNGAPEPSTMREALAALCLEQVKIFVKMRGGQCAVGTVERLTNQNLVLLSASRPCAFPIDEIIEVRRIEKERAP
jgi:hypothetical protein